MNPSKLPDDVFIIIFEALTAPFDLFQVIQTCRRFHDLAIRALYRKIYWATPLKYIDNTKFWERCDPSMALVPTSVVIGISHKHPSCAIENGVPSAVKRRPNLTSSARARAQWLRWVPFFTPKVLYGLMPAQVAAFSALRELVFVGAVLPDNVYHVIRAAPQLDALAFYDCTLPRAFALDIDTEDTDSDSDSADSWSDAHDTQSLACLPYTQLTLRRCVIGVEDGRRDMLVSHSDAMYFCSAPRLRVLSIDWTDEVSFFFAFHTDPHTLRRQRFRMSQQIRELTFHIPHTLTTRQFAVRFIAFIKRTPNLRRLKIVGSMRSFELPMRVIPHLEYYVGPLHTVLPFVKTRPVRHVEVTDTNKLSDYSALLPSLAAGHPDLHSLSLIIRSWDIELMFAITWLFSNLRALEITCGRGYPSEDTLVSFGGIFLCRLPWLETLRILLIPHVLISSSEGKDNDVTCEGAAGGGPPNESDGKGLINVWRKHCRRLREVQFVEGFVWRREFDGGEWYRRIPSSDIFPSDSSFSL